MIKMANLHATYRHYFFVPNVVANMVQDMNHAPMSSKRQELTKTRQRKREIFYIINQDLGANRFVHTFLSNI